MKSIGGGWKDGWIDRWVDGWKDGYIYAWMVDG